MQIYFACARLINGMESMASKGAYDAGEGGGGGGLAFMPWQCVLGGMCAGALAARLMPCHASWRETPQAWCTHNPAGQLRSGEKGRGSACLPTAFKTQHPDLCAASTDDIRIGNNACGGVFAMDLDKDYSGKIAQVSSAVVHLSDRISPTPIVGQSAGATLPFVGCPRMTGATASLWSCRRCHMRPPPHPPPLLQLILQGSNTTGTDEENKCDIK